MIEEKKFYWIIRNKKDKNDDVVYYGTKQKVFNYIKGSENIYKIIKMTEDNNGKN